MNGYFQMLIESRGTSVMLFPPTEGGEKIQVNEIREYLSRIGVPFDQTALNSALFNLDVEPAVFYLTPNRIPPVDEKCTVYVPADKQTGVLRLYPPSNDGANITKEAILETIRDARIRFGIDEAMIDQALAKKAYCTDIIIAKGTLPTAGRDAKIIYKFDTNNQARPELREDGSVDFFKLNTLHHCNKDQVLAEIIPAEKGQNGTDVYGTVTLAREVNRAKFDHGRNLRISEDGLQLISMVDGHVTCIDGAVFVSDVYSVENVDPSTGNIEYPGNVEVKGNVCENFQVKADGDVIVNGVVEGATIEAKGNIIIARGMHGQNKGTLIAGGNIIAKFISAANVKAGGFVEAEQILNSTVVAGTEVHVEAGKGLINGGRVVATKGVDVKNAGSAMGSTTIIEVGCDPEIKKRAGQLQKDTAEKTKVINQLKTSLATVSQRIQGGAKLTAEQILNVKNMQKLLQQEQEALQKCLDELQALDGAVNANDNARINVRGTMYQGVAITISGVNMAVKKDYTFCRLIRSGADIVSTNL